MYRWDTYVHAEGWLYYYTQPDPSLAAQYSTTADLQDPSILDSTNRAVEQLDAMLRAKSRPSRSDSVLEVVIECLDECSFQYYMVNHDPRCVFYAEAVDSRILAHPSTHLQSRQHLREFLPFSTSQMLYLACHMFAPYLLRGLR